MVKKPKFFIAVPTVGTVADALWYSLREIEKKYSDRVEFVYPEMCVRRIFHDFARSEMVKEFLATDADVLWFIDSDVVPPTNILDEYLRAYEEWDLAGAPYPLFIQQKDEPCPQVVYAVYNGAQGKGMYPADVPMEGTAFVDGVATGCIMVKRHIFEKLSAPYFEFEYNPETREMTRGEDIGFCRKVNALGYKFFVDFSKVCKHFKQVCLRDVNDYAMTYAKKQVNVYDAAVRAQLSSLHEGIKQAKQAKDAAKAAPKIIMPTKGAWIGPEALKRLK